MGKADGGGPRWLDDEEMAAWLAFLEASLRVFRSVEQQLRCDAGLSQQQYEILVKLSAGEAAGMRMTALAEALITSKSTLTYQVGQLERRGLVLRESVDGDVRGVTARLTDKGQEALRNAAPGHVKRVRETFVDLLDREQLCALAYALDRVASRLRDAED